MLAGSDRAFHYRIDDFQMRWIKRQRNVQIATLGVNVG